MALIPEEVSGIGGARVSGTSSDESVIFAYNIERIKNLGGREKRREVDKEYNWLFEEEKELKKHMKNRISHNKIRSFKTNDGEIIQSREAIEEEVVGFYKGLLGSSADTIPAIHLDIMKEENVLDRRQQLKLTEPVTVEEIHNALKGIEDLKAPGCDGFNIKFFKKSWGYVRKGISPGCMMKLNLQKAYDSIEWNFLEQVLNSLNIPERFIRWIMVCVRTVSYSILINGKPVEPFQARRGLRQGDPLAPYLFVLGMEYLTRIFKTLKYNPDFNFHHRCDKLDIIQLGFAYCLLLFYRGDALSIQMVYNNFMEISKTSRLKANATKSSIYFGGVP
uniref:Uncharacterized protein LOC104246284 n=1 Tax=Nicotiana sylvestris TaxID=4096 RepID=A0A1U7YB75_NICSY|nr:PREDICTED: uncharacterized protein LOC104246284 [Nicotiana sylvestris]